MSDLIQEINSLLNTGDSRQFNSALSIHRLDGSIDGDLMVTLSCTCTVPGPHEQV
jgi:hypothetical protein